MYDSEKIMSCVDENRHLGRDYARPELQPRMGGGNTSSSLQMLITSSAARNLCSTI